MIEKIEFSMAIEIQNAILSIKPFETKLKINFIFFELNNLDNIRTTFNTKPNPPFDLPKLKFIIPTDFFRNYL